MARSIAEVRLVGGSAALDFVNTVHDRHADDAEDYLTDYDRYLAWSLRAGLLAPAEARTLKHTAPPASFFVELRRLRDALHAVFAARIDRRAPDAGALARLDGWLQRAWRGLTLDLGRPAALAWRPEAVGAALPLERIALAALKVLQTCPPERLKRCAAVGECGWFFIDDTKNNRRRWCGMDTCGTKHKMRRYRRRLG